MRACITNIAIVVPEALCSGTFGESPYLRYPKLQHSVVDQWRFSRNSEILSGRGTRTFFGTQSLEPEQSQRANFIGRTHCANHSGAERIDGQGSVSRDKSIIYLSSTKATRKAKRTQILYLPKACRLEFDTVEIWKSFFLSF